LQHPHIVQIFEVGEHQGLPFLSLEYCPGGSLAARLAGTPLAGVEAARLVATLAGAVQAAHAQGVIHRDLKPANILLTTHGVPKIADFGLAKLLRREPGQTASGAVVGTPSYMAPEQAGDQVKEIGPAADVYALGAILYECLTGRPPFRAATTLETLLQVKTDEPVPPRQLQPQTPRDLETICLKCLYKEPGRRYASALDLAEDLRRFTAGEPIAARPVGVGERVVKWVKRRPVVAALLGLVVLLTAVGLAGIAWAYGEALRERNNAQTEATNARAAEANARAQRTAAKKAEADAREQKGAAEKAEKKAKAQLKETERALANSKVTLADALWREGQVALARERLDEVPDELRCWEWRYLKRATAGGLFTLHGHTGPVNSICFSPDGQRLATGSGVWDAQERRPVSGEVKVWNARTGQQLLTLQGHKGFVTSVCFSPDGQRLATGSTDNTAKVWDVRTWKELLTLQGHVSWVRGVAFSPDGKRLATGSGGYDQQQKQLFGEVKVWDARTGQQLLTLKGHTNDVTSVCFSPGGQALAAGSHGNTAKVWDTRTGQELLTLQGHKGFVTSVCFSPDGQRLATGGSADKTAKVWDTRTGQLLATLEGHTGEVLSVCFSPDGQRLTTGSSDNTAKVWDARTGQQLLTLKGHPSSVNSVAFSPDGQRLAIGSGIWDKEQRRYVSGEVKVWDARISQELLDLKGHTEKVDSVCFSPDGQRLATGSWDKTAKVWDARTGQQLLTLKGHTEKVYSVCFSPDGQRLAAGSYDSTAKVWDTRTGQQLLTLQGHPREVLSVCFSPDGRRLASGSGNINAGKPGEVKVWDAQTGQQLLALQGHTSGVNSVAFSPDSTRIASGFGGYDQQKMQLFGEVKVWDAQSGQQVLDLKGLTRDVRTVAFSPDGKRLASAGSGGWDAGGKPLPGEVKVWDARSGQQVLDLQGHTSWVSSVTFSPDGTRIASGSGGWDAGGKPLPGEVKVWDAQSGQQVLDLKGLTGSLHSVAFSPDGKRLATSGELTAKVWDGREIQPIPDAEELLVRRAHTRLDPDWHTEEAARHEQDQQWLAVAFHLEQMLTARPGDPARLLQVLSRAVMQQPELSSTWRRLALAQLQAGQVEAQRRTCEQMRQRFRVPGEVAQAGFALAAPPQPFGGINVALLRHPGLPPGAGLHDRLVTVRTAVLRPGALPEPESWLPLLPREEKLLRGAVLCRAGKHAEALKELEGLQDPVAVLFRALAEHGRGNKDAARRALDEALKQLPPEKIDLVEQTPPRWEQRVEGDALRREVETLLAAK
jgi:WD40 repeat protein